MALETTTGNTAGAGERIGKLISVSSLKVDVFLESTDIGLRDLIQTGAGDGAVRFEIAEVSGLTASAVCLGMTNGLKRGMDVYRTGGGLDMPYNDNILGHVFSPYGESIDGAPPPGGAVRNIYERSLAMGEIVIDGDILWTGIKVLDFFAPMRKGFKMGLLGGAGVGKTVLIKELIHNVYRGLQHKHTRAV
jgi:F-type H+-transporting ATPase subunit beta